MMTNPVLIVIKVPTLSSAKPEKRNKPRMTISQKVKSDHDVGEYRPDEEG